MKIEKLLEAHYPFVSEIHLAGIATGHATFEADSPAWAEWNSSHLSHTRFVAADGNKIVGWAALSPVSNRCVYAGVAEVSVYVAAGYRGKGVGNELLKALIDGSEANNIWILQAGIFPENVASLKLHYRNGFRLLGTREKVGKMNNTWRDVALLERRSKVVGID